MRRKKPKKMSPSSLVKMAMLTVVVMVILLGDVSLVSGSQCPSVCNCKWKNGKLGHSFLGMDIYMQCYVKERFEKQVLR